MIDDVEIPTHAPVPRGSPANGRGRGRGPRVPWRWRRRLRRPGKPRVKKLRLLLILFGLGILAVISTVFGMMMAVASDLPQIENNRQYAAAANSYLYDDHWHLIGQFASPNHEAIDRFDQISWGMRRAIVAVEDRRFWSDPGVDLRGIARAVIADATGGSRQGASTIAQQFVKNALSQQGNRTIFEKLREAALAYHLTRRWSKKKIMEQYLNSIYFGNGAYGVESAARVYFGKVHGYDSAAAPGETSSGCGDPPRHSCASMLTPPEAALLAGMVADPSAFDPLTHPAAALARRTIVLNDMLQLHDLSLTDYNKYRSAPLPTDTSLQRPQEPAAAPYFTSWLRPQILAAMGKGQKGVSDNVAEYRAYYGGLKIRTTLDLKLQQAADQAISQELPVGENLPSASLVAIDNKTGEVRAMVGGPIINGEEDYNQYPFNLATQGRRQPGSSFKPFTLAMALQYGGYGPDSVIDSAPQDFIVPNSGGKEHFIVHNFGNTYSGPTTLANATDYSDNTVFAQVGIHTGTQKIAAFARRAGIRSPVSHNYAMILGGLKVGVSPLDMAHAYETFAEGGRRVYDKVLGAPHKGPTGIAQIYCPSVCPVKNLDDHPEYQRVLPASVAAVVHEMLTGVVQRGTGTEAQISGVDVAGKTGTTTNYADAWFVGWTPQLTTAVWVGFPNKLVPMISDYNGAPVEGGTYPAIIWQHFMVQALEILAAENPSKSKTSTTTSTTTDTTGSGVTSPSGTGVSTSSTATTPAPTGAGTTGGANAGGTQNGGGTAGGGAAGGTTGGGGGTTGGGGGTAGGTTGGGGGAGGTTGGGGGAGGSTGGGGGGGGSGGAGLGGGG
ncbi:MAG TPA: transglycosylase domain-containing protein [Solirubrobacteraceae bacterium]|nr:transglycosylase domain-containing protein [Solirubrobacteraceae bacterium]